jgi:DNA polymerase-3 subunit epsilon
MMDAETISARLARILAPGFPPESDWTKLPLAVIDFETTGIDPAEHRIVEYGFALFDDGKFQQATQGLLNPGMPISEEASKVNGITDQDVADKPTFEQYFDELADVLRGRVPVAYNVEFDRNFLLNEVGRVIRKRLIEDARRNQQATITAEVIDSAMNPDDLPAAFRQNVEWIDPLVWARKIYKYEKGGNKLVTVCKRLNITIDRAHRADADAKAAGEVLLALAPKIEQPSYYHLIKNQKDLAISQQRELERWLAQKK